MVEAKNGWSERVAKEGHLFLRNIYSNDEMKQMDMADIESYKEVMYRLVDLHSYFDVALQDDVITNEIGDFIIEDLNGNY